MRRRTPPRGSPLIEQVVLRLRRDVEEEFLQEVAAWLEAKRGSLAPAVLNLAQVERRAIEAALVMTNGNRVRAAEVLGINRATLYNKLNAYKRDDLATPRRKKGSGR